MPKRAGTGLQNPCDYWQFGRDSLKSAKMFTIWIPAPPRYDSHLNMGCGTNAGAASISPLNISVGL